MWCPLGGISIPNTSRVVWKTYSQRSSIDGQVTVGPLAINVSSAVDIGGLDRVSVPHGGQVRSGKGRLKFGHRSVAAVAGPGFDFGADVLARKCGEREVGRRPFETADSCRGIGLRHDLWRRVAHGSVGVVAGQTVLGPMGSSE